MNVGRIYRENINVFTKKKKKIPILTKQIHISPDSKKPDIYINIHKTTHEKQDTQKLTKPAQRQPFTSPKGPDTQRNQKFDFCLYSL